jgi:peptidoglycan/LPS O-acetylase OafA/YrhL
MLGFKIDFDKRIFGFDLLRAFAIFCVIHGHGRHILKGTLLEGFPWFILPHGVDIFFVISGFLIGYSFIVNANKTNGKLTFSKILNFWKRSALRILPNYYLILVVNYILVNGDILNGSTDKFSFWKFFTFTQNLFYPFYDFFWESWSLATQEWFYLLFPIFVLVLGNIFKLKYNIPIISIIFIMSSVLYRFSISDLDYDSFWWDVNFRKVALSRFDCIYIGVIAAWFRFYFKEYWTKYALPLFLLGVLLFILHSNLPREINSIYFKVFYLSIAPIYIVMWFPLVDRLKDTKSVFGKLITYFNILSYAMYLFNLMVIQILDRHYSTALPNNATLKYIIFWLITIFLSYLLYILYENPISTLGNRLLHTTKMMYKRIGLNERNKTTGGNT